MKFQQKKLQMSQNLQNFVKFQKFQLENLVDFEKCCKTRIFLQKSEPIQPKTSNIMPKFCQPTLSDVSAPELREGPRAGRAVERRALRGLEDPEDEPGLQIRVRVEFEFRTYSNFRTYTVP